MTGSNTLAAGGTLTNSGTLTLSNNAILGDAGVLENDGVTAIDASLLQVANLTGNGALTLGPAVRSLARNHRGGRDDNLREDRRPAVAARGARQHGRLGHWLRARRYDRPGRCRSGIGPIYRRHLSFSVGGSAASFSLGLASKASLLAPCSDGKGGTQITATALCFCAGTRIATRDGDVAIEHLQVGDLVRVVHPRNELQPVIWMGHRTVNCARHPDPRTVWPVRIAAGAFGPGRPIAISIYRRIMQCSSMMS